MSDYFKFFPKVKHTNRSAVDITRRTKLLDYLQGNPFVFLPYTVENDDRPEHIAEFYYGSQDKVWLVYYANNIIDVYSQWPMNDYDFHEYFKKKYETLSGTTGLPVIHWGQNQQITTNIIYYQNLNNENIQITPFSYDNDPSLQAVDWRPIRYYEYETILNNNKRNIYLIDNRYVDQFESQQKELINE